MGVSHETAPVAIREQIAVSADGLRDFLSQLHSCNLQGVILSTCNRTEIYTTGDKGGDGAEASLNFLKARLDVPDDTLLKYVYILRDKTAAEHLFRVACGLDSMIVGEFEVLGQVSHALEIAEEAGMVSLPLRQVFHRAMRAGRRVRKETGISKNVVSVSSVAVNLAATIVGDLKSCKMLVVGAGEAGRLVAKVARDSGTSQIVVANRTRERAAALGGKAVDMSNIGDELATASIVVTCATAPHWILRVQQVEEAMRKRPELPLVVVDIAVPRNVEPAITEVRNVFLYNIDDLTEISNLNRKQREREIRGATDVMSAELDKLTSWWRVLEVTPVCSALMGRAENIRRTQLDKTLGKLHPLSCEERDSLEAMTKSIVTKILNDPIQYLKANGGAAETVKELFSLDMEK